MKNKIPTEKMKLISVMLLISILFLPSVFSLSTDGLVAYWKANNDAYDSLNRTNGTAYNGAGYGGAKLGSNGFFFGSGKQYFNFSLAPELAFTTELYTVSLWFNVSTTVGDMYLIGRGDWKQDGWFITFNPSSNAFTMYQDTAGAREAAYNTNCTYIFGQYNHFAFTRAYNISLSKMYLNGARCSLASVTGSDNFINASNVSTRNFIMASSVPYNASGTANYKGGLDEIAIFRINLSESQMRELYNNGSGLSYPFVPSYPAFNVTLSHGLNNTRFNSWNGSITFNLSNFGNCTINDSYFNYVSNGYYVTFNKTPTAGIYNITYVCNDSYAQSTTGFVYFEYDTTIPSITINYPSNINLNYSSLPVSIDFSDNFQLWAINITIKNSTGGIYYSNYIDDLPSLFPPAIYYNYTNTIDLINLTSDVFNGTFPNGNFTIIAEAWDSHTDALIDSKINPPEKFDLFRDITNIEINEKSIDIIYPAEADITFLQKNDRVSWEIKNIDYFFISGKNLIEVKNSPYPCHYISDGAIWIDCSGLVDPKVTQIDENNIRIDYILKEGEIAKVESTGALNYGNTSAWFNLDNIPPFINMTHPTNNSIQSSGLFDRKLNFTISESSNCILSGFTSYTLDFNDSTHYYYSLSGLVTGIYDYSLSCSDTVQNLNTTYYRFTYNETSTGGTGTVTTNVSVNVDFTPVLVLAIWVIVLFIRFKNSDDLFMAGLSFLVSIIAGLYFVINPLGNTPLFGFAIALIGVIISFA